MTTEAKNKKISIIGLFDDRPTLDRAIDTLRANGFPDQDISALLPDVEGTKQVASEKHTKAPEGAMAGAAAGGVAGGTLGLLVGLGALAIPGLGPFIAAGPIVAALAGAGAGGAVGTLTGSLIGLGIPEYEAKSYESYLNKGGMLLAVHADDNDRAKAAKDILNQCGAHDVNKKGEADARDPSAATRR